MKTKQNRIISFLLAVCLCLLLVPNVNGAAQSSAASFVKEVRDKMIARQTEIPLSFTLSDAVLKSEYDNDMNKYCDVFFDELFAEVYKHDGTYKGGDYLKNHTGEYGLSLSFSKASTDPNWAVDAVLHISYHTTAAQEDDVEDEMDKVIKNLSLNGLTDYEKINAVYNYLSAISYDYENLEDDSYTLKYSAYAALINRKAVCQGFANLFYLFMQRLGIDCRIISGFGLSDKGEYEPHAWNIVRIGAWYYNCDSTWDIGAKTFRWFLKGSKYFPKHAADEAYLTEAFRAAYPIAEKDYDPNVQQEHTHAWLTVAGYAPTCTEPGRTEKIYCPECGEVMKDSTVIPASGHKPQAIPEIQPTCTLDGHHGGTECSVCFIVLTPYITDLRLGHDLVTETVTPPTYTQDGMARTYCTRCNYVITAVIPMLTEEPVVYKPGDVDNDGTVTAGDARLALRAAVGLEQYAPASAEFVACDVDHNNSITAADARSILRAAVKLETLA